jgi:hypothetical protein
MNEILEVWIHANKWIFVTINCRNLLQWGMLDMLISISEGMCWLHPENCYISSLIQESNIWPNVPNIKTTKPGQMLEQNFSLLSTIKALFLLLISCMHSTAWCHCVFCLWTVQGQGSK